MYRILFFIICFFLALPAWCDAKKVESGDLNEESSIRDIDYVYGLVNDSQHGLDCIGTLNLTVESPQDLLAVVFERTEPHMSDGEDLRFLIKSSYPIADNMSTIVISAQNIYWGTYFRVCMVFQNGSREYSPTYCVNTYISPEDLQRLEAHSKVDTSFVDSVSLTFDGRDLYVHTTEGVLLSVVDLSGKVLFSGYVNKPTSVSLDRTDTTCLIIRYSIGGKTMTKKLLLKRD